MYSLETSLHAETSNINGWKIWSLFHELSNGMQHLHFGQSISIYINLSCINLTLCLVGFLPCRWLVLLTFEIKSIGSMVIYSWRYPDCLILFDLYLHSIMWHFLIDSEVFAPLSQHGLTNRLEWKLIAYRQLQTDIHQATSIHGIETTIGSIRSCILFTFFSH